MSVVEGEGAKMEAHVQGTGLANVCGNKTGSLLVLAAHAWASPGVALPNQAFRNVAASRLIFNYARNQKIRT